MIRLGIIDCDSSHSIEFTRRLNHVGLPADQLVQGAQVVCAVAGPSVMSPERVPIFTSQLESCGVELLDRPEDVIGRVDAVLVLSVCGAVHRERVEPFLRAGLPAYVDKPFACTLADAEAIFGLAAENNVAVWSSSAMRFSQELLDFAAKTSLYGAVQGALSYGPAKLADGNPGLFHYGIHPVEMLFTLMGPGCEQVRCDWTEGAETVTGHWADGRLGTVRGTRTGATYYGAVAFCDNSVVTIPASARYGYRNLCREIVRAFETGQPPVPPEQTLEIVRFVLAAEQSRQSAGQSVRLADVG